jgi:hypothetical protein
MKLFESIVILIIGIAEGMLINDWIRVREELNDMHDRLRRKKKPLIKREGL